MPAAPARSRAPRRPTPPLLAAPDAQKFKEEFVKAQDTNKSLKSDGAAPATPDAPKESPKAEAKESPAAAKEEPAKEEEKKEEKKDE